MNKSQVVAAIINLHSEEIKDSYKKGYAAKLELWDKDKNPFPPFIEFKDLRNAWFLGFDSAEFDLDNK